MGRNLDRLDQAIRANDARSVESIAHNCAGTSANCGLTAVVELFYELERMAREQQLTEAANEATQATNEFARAELFLQERFQEVMV